MTHTNGLLLEIKHLKDFDNASMATMKRAARLGVPDKPTGKRKRLTSQETKH